MIKVVIRMKALPGKLKELTQTLAALVKSAREVKGCRNCDFCCNPEDESELCIFEEWECGEELNNHMQSEHFKVLLGARGLLKTPHEVKVYHEMKPGTDASALELTTCGGA